MSLSVKDENHSSPNKGREEQTFKQSGHDLLGYFIYYGVSTCRVYEILKDGKTLKSLHQISYEKGNENVNEDNLSDYFQKIIDITYEKIQPLFAEQKTLFVKTCADPNFFRLFENEIDRDTFIFDFYKRTGLCFNILSYSQAERNLSNSFKALQKNDVIINIGMSYVDVFINQGSDFDSINLPFGVSSIESYINEKKIDEEWTQDSIKSIKQHIKKLIGSRMPVGARNAYILKDELSFMQDMGYPLLVEKNGDVGISMDGYRRSNRKLLFQIDYKNLLNSKYPDEADVRRAYGYKFGHIILETLFELIGVRNIFPSNYHCIHGNADAYIFKIVVGGSFSSGNIPTAIKLLQKMGARITSPQLVNGKLVPINDDTNEAHLIALKQCDLFFVANDNENGYFGEQTSHQIYGAQILNKQIAYWKEPSKDLLEVNGVGFIPHECWERKMNALGNNSDDTN